MESVAINVPAAFAWRRRIQFAIRVVTFVAGLYLLFVSDLESKSRATIGATVSVALLAIHYLTWACPRCAKSFSFLSANIRFCPHCGVLLRDER